MSFDPNLSVSDGTDTHVYSEISRFGNETIRRVASFGTIIPKTLKISHMRANSPYGGKSDRHIVRNDQVFNIDPNDLTKLAQASVYTVIQVADSLPDKAVIVAKMLKENQVVCSSTNLAKLLNGES